MFVIVFILLTLIGCYGETWIQFNNYVTMDKNLRVNMLNFITDRRHYIDLIKRKYATLARQVPDKVTRSDYLQNLHQLFSLSHRLSKHWTALVAFANPMFFENKRNRIKLIKNIRKLPVSSVRALVRLQEVYNISTKTLISGDTDKPFLHLNLSGSDCFDIGLYYYSLQHHRRSIEWFTEALRIDELRVSRECILEYLYLAHCFSGDVIKSSEYLTQLLQEHPTFRPSAELLANHTAVSTRDCQVLAEQVEETMYDDDEAAHWVELSELCRGLEQKPPTVEQLKCRLIHYNQPHLRLYPFKLEEIYIDPPILMFHDVIYEREIEYMKTKFHNKTKHAYLDYSPDHDPQTDTQYNAWIESIDPNNTVANRISNRTLRMTNMGSHRALSLMLASYGLGGEIKPHYDMGDPEHNITKNYTRADYLTVMYYLNDNQVGGQTIFPLIDLAVAPKKGSALVWFNRYPNWEQIDEMLHSSCPIIQGSKWIMIKWLHVMQQEFPKCSPGRQMSFKHYYL